MDPIRIGMIGAGVHSTNMLYPSLEHQGDAIRAVAVCDKREERARFAAKQFGFDRSYVGYEEMIEKEALDAVIICLNGGLHPKAVSDCLSSGLDVLVEKPLATTVEAARSIEEQVAQTGRILMVEHQKRYSQAYQYARQLIRDRDFGEITMVECKMHGKPYETIFNLFAEWHIHGIDLVQAFAGDIVGVKASMQQLAPNRAAIAVVLEFESGAVGTMSLGSEGGFGRFCERLEVIGNRWKGVYVENARDVVFYDHSTNDLMVRNTSLEWRQDWLPIHANFTHALDGYVGIIQQFVKSVRTREQASPSATDERKALEVIFEILSQLGVPADWKYVASDY